MDTKASKNQKQTFKIEHKRDLIQKNVQNQLLKFKKNIRLFIFEQTSKVYL